MTHGNLPVLAVNFDTEDELVFTIHMLEPSNAMPNGLSPEGRLALTLALNHLSRASWFTFGIAATGHPGLPAAAEF